MKPQKHCESLWIIVKVESGIPVMAEAHRSRQSAELREQVLRRCMHPENDETGIFEVRVEQAIPSDEL